MRQGRKCKMEGWAREARDDTGRAGVEGAGRWCVLPCSRRRVQLSYTLLHVQYLVDFPLLHKKNKNNSLTGSNMVVMEEPRNHTMQGDSTVVTKNTCNTHL